MAINVNEIRGFSNSGIVRKSKGAIGVVKKDSCNKVTISKNLLKQLGNPTEVQFGFINDNLIIGTSNSFENADTYTLKKYKNTSSMENIVYSSQLVEEITNFFELDFSTKTSITFGKYEIQTEDNIAVISK